MLIVSSVSIYAADRIIPAIGKHIVAEEALAGGNEDVGIDESADFGIVITGLEVIESSLSVIDLASGCYWPLLSAPSPPPRPSGRGGSR